MPWLRGHLGDLLREYLDTVEVRIDRGAAGGLPSLPDLAEFVERFREGGLAALVQSGAQREILDRVQAAMAVVEGHAEHLMDALAPELVPEHEGLREAMDAPPGRAARRPSGSSCACWAWTSRCASTSWARRSATPSSQEGGIELLNRVWDSPEALPDAGRAGARPRPG